jgi:hypothetical protein
MSSYRLYVGAKFEVGKGVTMKIYRIVDLDEYIVSYLDHLSESPRRSTIENFTKFLEKTKARQV